MYCQVLIRTADCQEAVKAFWEKRPPVEALAPRNHKSPEISRFQDFFFPPKNSKIPQIQSEARTAL